MSRRKHLVGVAEGTVTSFVSRNNELDGYWAIGMLCRSVGVGELELEILPASESSRLGDIAGRARDRLRRHLVALGLPTSTVSGARIRLSFERGLPRPPRISDAADVHYRCCAILVDALGREHRAEAAGWCWPHDPTRERRRYTPP